MKMKGKFFRQGGVAGDASPHRYGTVAVDCSVILDVKFYSGILGRNVSTQHPFVGTHPVPNDIKGLG